MVRLIDNHIAGLLAKQGVDPRFVALKQDYASRSLGKEHSPYARFWEDPISDIRVMVTSGLPMIDAYGNHHELIWRERGGILENGNNIFHCVIKEGTVRLIVLSDQPYGIKKDTECSYHAQLIINGSEVLPNNSIPLILATDPTNENYHDNVLLIQYATICRRRIRIIEGRYRERWFIDANPNGKVEIRHNKTGKLPLKFGYAFDANGFPVEVKVTGSSEIIEASEFDRPDIKYPVEIGGSLTVYPDAGTGNTTVDGWTYHLEKETWAFHQTAVGTNADDVGDYVRFGIASTTLARWWWMSRTQITLDATAIPDDAIKTAVTLTIYGESKVDALGISPTANIFSSNPANNNAIVAGDHDSLGNTPFATAITYANYETGTPGNPNTFTFNEAGRTAVSLSVITELGIREEQYDAENDEPAHGDTLNSFFDAWSADKGVGYKPTLVVTYYIPKVPVTDGDLIGIPVIRKS